MKERRIILASASRARRGMLKAAGLTFEILPPDVDEASIRASMAENPETRPEEIARALARAKAEAVGREHLDALVIGADQVLSLGPEVFEKCTGIEDARTTLLRLRGETHALHSGVALAEGGKTAWSHVETARLTMRRFSNTFLCEYLARGGESVSGMLGAYELEGLGAQLFESIDGDYFTILGLPLLPLLAELRSRQILPS